MLKGLCGKIAVCAIVIPLLAGFAAAQQTATGNVPSLINFGGTITDINHRPLQTLTGVTFSLYADSEGGSPLWIETQNVQPDKNGRYTARLGAATSGGIPTALFTSGEARWLGVQVSGEPEQPRVMLLAVPYALKAADAQTVGGLPASAFVLAAPSALAANSPVSPPSSPANLEPTVGGGGTTGYLAGWVDNNGDLGNSTVFQSGTGSTAKIGINEKTPLATLDVNGSGLFRGILEMATTGFATASKGYNSNQFNIESSAFNSSTNKYSLQHFVWQAEPAGNNTVNPAATLNLLFATDPNIPVETGLKLSNTGIVTFASGQTFPGTGTITGLTTAAGSGLTGGGTSGTLNLSLLNTCAANQVLQWNGTKWACSSAGTGTITGITAGTDLTGGGTSGNVTLNVDTTKIPQLNIANTFTGLQTINVNGGTEALNVTQQATVGQSYGILGTTLSTGNRSAGILGQNLASFGIAFGIEGYIADGDGAGVFGLDGNPLSQTGGSLSGTFGSGVWGDGSSQGLGMIATADANSAIAAYNNSDLQTTILAENQTTSGGQLAPAIAGFSFAPIGMAVVGSGPIHSNTFLNPQNRTLQPYGVGGDSPAGTGVGGFTDSGTAVAGFSNSNGNGVVGSSAAGSGVLGSSQMGAGVAGVSSAVGDPGVYGVTTNPTMETSYGVWGDDPSESSMFNAGIFGTSQLGYGVAGISAYVGVHGATTANGTAGMFEATLDSGFPFYAYGPDGGCTLDSHGNFACGGTSSAMVQLPDQRWVTLSAVESPENWFEDFGSGQLSKGSAEIALDPTFAELVSTGSDYRVFPVPDGDCKGLYIAQKNAMGFVVRELGGGKSSVAFDYRIVARRKGYENVRLKDITEDYKHLRMAADRGPMQIPQRPDIHVPRVDAGRRVAIQPPTPILPRIVPPARNAHVATPLQNQKR